jgi:hypothetical protein
VLLPKDKEKDKLRFSFSQPKAKLSTKTKFTLSFSWEKEKDKLPAKGQRQIVLGQTASLSLKYFLLKYKVVGMSTNT